jgi:hypothetical protein
LTGLPSMVISTPHRPGQTRRPRVQRHDKGAGTRPRDCWVRYCDGTSDSLIAPAPGRGPARLTVQPGTGASHPGRSRSCCRRGCRRGGLPHLAGGTLPPAGLGRDALEHVAERARALQVVVIQPDQLQPGIHHQPADRPVDMAAAEDLVRPGEFGGRYVCELLVSLPDPSAR